MNSIFCPLCTEWAVVAMMPPIEERAYETPAMPAFEHFIGGMPAMVLASKARTMVIFFT
jgi:hypothetical protein